MGNVERWARWTGGDHGDRRDRRGPGTGTKMDHGDRRGPGTMGPVPRTKRGFTLAECLVCTLVLSIVLAASIPFLVQIKTKQVNNEKLHMQTLSELSDINYALASNTLEELNNRDTPNITIEKVEDMPRLYKIVGKKTKSEVYIVVKEVE